MPRFDGDLRLFWTAMIYSPVAVSARACSSSSRRFANGSAFPIVRRRPTCRPAADAQASATGARLRASAPAATRAAPAPRSPSTSDSRSASAEYRLVSARADSSASSASHHQLRRLRDRCISQACRQRWQCSTTMPVTRALDRGSTLERSETQLARVPASPSSAPASASLGNCERSRPSSRSIEPARPPVPSH